MERAPTITTRTVPVTIARITTIERILVALEHKESSKNRYYKHY